MTTDERMEQMEGQVARIRWINRCLIACIVGALAVWFISKGFVPETARAGSDARETRANRFVLEDANLKPRATLEMSKDGPVLTLNDENLKPRLSLGVAKNDPVLVLMDANLKPRVSLCVSKDGPVLVLNDENLKPRSLLGVDTVALKDGNGKDRVGMILRKDGPGLKLNDENGKEIWSAP